MNTISAIAWSVVAQQLMFAIALDRMGTLGAMVSGVLFAGTVFWACLTTQGKNR